MVFEPQTSYLLSKTEEKTKKITIWQKDINVSKYDINRATWGKTYDTNYDATPGCRPFFVEFPLSLWYTSELEGYVYMQLGDKRHCED